VDSSCEAEPEVIQWVLTPPHSTELTPEPHTKTNSSRDLKDSKLTETFAFILVDDSNPERRKKNRSIAHSHVKRTNQRTKRESVVSVTEVNLARVPRALEGEVGG
jgi:hypothetical protein